MGEVFEVEPVPVPIVVYARRQDGTTLPTRHLTDDHRKTLCGRGNPPFLLGGKDETATCKTCLAAVDGWARFYRLIR